MRGPIGILLALPLLFGSSGRAFGGWGTGGSQISQPSSPSDPVAHTVVAGGYIVWAGAPDGAPSTISLVYALNGPGQPIGHPCVGPCPGTGPITQTNPVAAVDDNGKLFVAWLDERPGCTGGTCFSIYAQVFCGSGTTPGWNSPQNLTRNFPPDVPKSALAITKLTGGGVFVAWREGSTSQIAGSLLTSNMSCSAPIDTTILVAPGGTGDQTNPAAVSDGNGGVYVVWQDSRNPSNDDDIYGQHVSPTGTLLWGTSGAGISTDCASQQDPAIASDGRGGAIAAWRSAALPTGDGDIFATCFYTNGVPPYPTTPPQPPLVPGFRWPQPLGTSCVAGIDPWPRVPVCVELGDQTSPAIVSDGLQGALITWQDARPPAGTNNRYAVYCQRLDLNGQPARYIWPSGTGHPARVSIWPTGGIQVQSDFVDAGSQYAPSIATDGNHGATIAWSNWLNDIYVQWIGQGGNLGLDASLVCDDGVAYQIEPGIGFVGTGVMSAWHDERQPGNDVFGTRRDRPELVAVEPIGSSVAMSEIWPNPFRDQVSFRLAVSSPAQVRVEIFDLLGRKIRTLVSGAYGPGGHRIEWNGRDDLGVEVGVGIYMLRARSGDGELRHRLVRIQ